MMNAKTSSLHFSCSSYKGFARFSTMGIVTHQVWKTWITQAPPWLHLRHVLMMIDKNILWSNVSYLRKCANDLTICLKNTN